MSDAARILTDGLPPLSLHPEHQSAGAFRGLLGRTDIMGDIFQRIERVGRTDVTVLLAGESGTGKELAARALHDVSGRHARPFVALNCSALPADLVESELFGHTRGAFTGAVRDHGGLFEAAHGGTLFLDEIGDLSAAAQAKVLRALENGEVLRVGGTRTTHVNVRLIAATNQSLEAMVEAGTFREDLLYRLKVISITMPPLRERRSDIALLAQHFLGVYGERHTSPVREISPEALVLLEQHIWPGNVRELRNAIEGAVVMCDGERLDVVHLPTSVRETDSAAVGVDDASAHQLVRATQHLPFTEAREQALRAFDRAFLAAALARHDGNIARTARALGLHRQSLQKLLARRAMRPSRDQRTAAPDEPPADS